MLSLLYTVLTVIVTFSGSVTSDCVVYGACDHYPYPQLPPDDTACVIDPNDPGSIEVYFAACPCYDAKAFGTAVYFSNDGSLGTATAVNPSTLVASVDQWPTLSFDVPYTNLAAQDAAVTIVAGYAVGSSIVTAATWDYTVWQQSTIVYAATTTSVTQPVYTTTTVTATNTDAYITVFPGPTVTSKCTAAVNTVTARPLTSTVITTSTPTTVTKSKTVLSTSTTTLTCVPSTGPPAPSVSPVAVRRRGAFATVEPRDLVPRQAAFPQCIHNPITTTTIYTSTFVASVVSTSTITEVAYTTQTVSTSSTMPAVTVCNKASSTLTITSTITKTKTTRVPTPYTTTTFTVGVVQTKVPKNLPYC